MAVKNKTRRPKTKKSHLRGRPQRPDKIRIKPLDGMALTIPMLQNLERCGSVEVRSYGVVVWPRAGREQELMAMIENLVSIGLISCPQLASRGENAPEPAAAPVPLAA